MELASKLYKVGLGDWTDYTTGVTVTTNTTVSFKAVDTAGNETADSYVVSNIATSEPDNVKPVVSNAKADVTAPTKQDVTVTAEFADDVELKSTLYRIDDGEWQAYTGGVAVDKNATVSFKAVDTSDNESDVVIIVVDNIDKVLPTITNITPSTTEPAASVTVTAEFADDVELASKLYKVGLGDWTDYTTGVTVTTNTTVSFKAVDTAGNEVTESFVVSNIVAIDPDNKPDDGTNDYLYDKKKGWNTATNIEKFAANTVAGNGELDLDLPGTVDKSDKHNLFGNDGTNMDTGDVAAIGVNTAAKLTFTIDSTAAGTFYVYEDGEKKGKRAQITVGKVAVKAGQTATLKDVCLTAGDGKYYVAMVAKNVRKVGAEGLYNVNVSKSTFFVDADNKANDAASDGKVIAVGRETGAIVLDKTPMTGSAKFDSFVGFGDGVDYAKLDLASSGYLKFTLTGEGDGTAKFTIWKCDTAKNNKMTKVGGVTTLNAKNGFKATTKAQFLDTDKYTYYVSMECSDAAKGKGMYYNVAVADDSVFFDSADKGRNDVLYDKKGKAFYAEDEKHHFESTNVGGAGVAVKLDGDPVGDAGYENFVGYGDAADYAKIELASDGTLSFDLKATGDATFVVYRKGQDKKGNDTLEAIRTTKLTVAKDKDVVETSTGAIAGLKAGEYYVSMTAKSTKANDKGSVFYSVMATLEPSVADALAMPETSGSLGISPDSLSFGQNDADALADASSSLAELDDKAAWQNIGLLA